MKIQVITSFDQHYYDRIGRYCVESWLEHWPQQLSLTCYLEGMDLKAKPRMEFVSFDNLGSNYERFQSASVKGRVHVFAKKAYSVIHAMWFGHADRLIWIDADVITQRAVPMSLLSSILPDSVLSTHMGVTYTEHSDRRSGTWFVPETGFFAVNRQHALFEQFRYLYSDRYDRQDFAGLRRSYDNDVYGWAIRQLDAPSLDLCDSLKKPYKTPLKHTVLGPYLHHYKAKHSKDWFVNNQEDQ